MTLFTRIWLCTKVSEPLLTLYNNNEITFQVTQLSSVISKQTPITCYIKFVSRIYKDILDKIRIYKNVINKILDKFKSYTCVWTFESMILVIFTHVSSRKNRLQKPVYFIFFVEYLFTLYRSDNLDINCLSTWWIFILNSQFIWSLVALLPKRVDIRLSTDCKTPKKNQNS